MHTIALVIGYDGQDIKDILYDFVEKGIEYFEEDFLTSKDYKGLVLNDKADKSQYNVFTYEDGKEYVHHANADDVDIEKSLENVGCIISDRYCIYDTDFLKDFTPDEKGRQAFNMFVKRQIFLADELYAVDVKI